VPTLQWDQYYYTANERKSTYIHGCSASRLRTLSPLHGRSGYSNLGKPSCSTRRRPPNSHHCMLHDWCTCVGKMIRWCPTRKQLRGKSSRFHWHHEPICRAQMRDKHLLSIHLQLWSSCLDLWHVIPNTVLHVIDPNR
jgi:hypothetical protein